MKKIIFASFVFVSLIACNSSGGKEEKKDNANDITQNPDYQKGIALIAKSNCLTCHKIDDPLTGPPYREVANKYAGMPDTIIDHLAKKIISGGTGVWGQIPMIAHPEISEDDAKAMVKYILLLKK